jgi:hypothetical protein
MSHHCREGEEEGARNVVYGAGVVAGIGRGGAPALGTASREGGRVHHPLSSLSL